MREYLKSFRQKEKLTQHEIASKLDIKESYYKLIENGVRQKELSLNFLMKLSKVFNIRPELIMIMEIKYKEDLKKRGKPC